MRDDPSLYQTVAVEDAVFSLLVWMRLPVLLGLETRPGWYWKAHTAGACTLRLGHGPVRVQRTSRLLDHVHTQHLAELVRTVLRALRIASPDP